MTTSSNTTSASTTSLHDCEGDHIIEHDPSAHAVLQYDCSGDLIENNPSVKEPVELW